MNGVFNGRNDIGSDDEEDEEQQEEEEDDEEAAVEEDVDVAAAAAAAAGAAGSRCRWWCRGRILGSLWGYSNLKHTHLSHVSL